MANMAKPSQQLFNDEVIIALSDDDNISDKTASVSLQRWLLQRDKISQHKQIGLRLKNDDDLSQLDTKTLTKLPFITLDCANFDNGRFYSQAKLLRSRLSYQGKIIGLDAHIDQLQMMLRCGINVFQLAKQYNNADAQAYLKRYPVYYQRASNND